jgi:competence protein ComGC
MSRLGTAGFTLVEVLVLSPIIMITIVITMTFLFNQYGQLTQQGAQLNLNVEAQNIAFSMQDDVFFASSFDQNKNDELVDAFQPSGGWRYNSNPATLIISTPALTANHRSPNRQPVYVDTEGCDASVIANNAPLFNNVIYFVSGTRLYKRILTAPTGLATCGASYLKQSCPSASVTATCPADRLLTDKLQTASFTYYDTNNTVITNPELAEKLKVDLTLKDRAFAEDITATSSITLRKLNQ